MRVIETKLHEILKSHDWAQVFADENAGNVDKTTDPCPPGSDVDTSPPSRTDIKKVIASAEGENDGEDWVGVFLLKDGRYLMAYGGCDYTGWDCRASNQMEVAKTLDDLVRFGLSDRHRDRLGFKQPKGV